MIFRSTKPLSKWNGWTLVQFEIIKSSNYQCIVCGSNQGVSYRLYTFLDPRGEIVKITTCVFNVNKDCCLRIHKKFDADINEFERVDW